MSMKQNSKTCRLEVKEEIYQNSYFLEAVLEEEKKKAKEETEYGKSATEHAPLRGSPQAPRK